MKINNLLKECKITYLYNVNLYLNDALLQCFQGVKYICMQGSSHRTWALAKILALKFANADLECFEPINLLPNSPFHCYRVDKILCVSHGMGTPSILTLLDSISKIMYFAGNYDVEYIRIGTSGGIGVAAGTVILTQTSYMSDLTPGFRLAPLGKSITYPTNMDGALNERILKSQPSKLEFNLLTGNTIAADDFYLGQARFDGFIKPRYDEAKRQKYFEKIQKLNILNFEMEGTALAAFCNRAEIPAAMIAVTALNRFEGDQVMSSHEILEGYSSQASTVAINYLSSQLKLITI